MVPEWTRFSRSRDGAKRTLKGEGTTARHPSGRGRARSERPAGHCQAGLAPGSPVPLVGSPTCSRRGRRGMFGRWGSEGRPQVSGPGVRDEGRGTERGSEWLRSGGLTLGDPQACGQKTVFRQLGKS